MRIFKCKFCGKEYKSEKTFMKHKCAKMKRFMYVVNHNYLNYWRELKTAYNIKYKEDRENPYYDMINSKLYNQIIVLFDWCAEMGISHIKDYCEYTKRMNIPISLWCKALTYHKYLQEMLASEHPLLAKERSEKFLKDNNVSLDTITQNFLYFSLLNGSISNKYLKSKGFDVKKFLDNKQISDLRDFL